MSIQFTATPVILPPIADYGVIGNCHTAALISSRGSLDWLCLPRFDSPSLFARILDSERGGYWSIQPDGDIRADHQYLPNTNILVTNFENAYGHAQLLNFIDVTNSDATATQPQPGHVTRILVGVHGEMDVLVVCAPRPDYARELPQFNLDGPVAVWGRWKLVGPAPWVYDEQLHAVTCRIRVRAGQRYAWTLITDDQPHALAPQPLLEANIAFWERWAARCTYVGPYRDAVVRSALTLKLMTDAPSGAIVAAPTTSLPETIGGIRNWDYRFTWIRDASFTLYALLLAGYLDADDPFFNWIVATVKVKETGISTLYPISSDGQMTEQTLDHLRGYYDSRPVRIGNGAADQLQLDLYGEVFDALYFACKTGQYDPAPVWEHFRALADWVAEHWHEPENGIWEVRGGLRHVVYGKVMCWVALDRAIQLAEMHDLAGDLQRWRAEREQVRADVFAKGWSERLGAFKQSYEDERLDAANLLLPVVGFIDGTDPRMQATIDATLKQLVVDGLCYRYLDAPEGLSGKEATFVLCTFWLVDALILAGRAHEAQTLFEGVLRRATSLGLFAEEIDHHTGAHLGNFPQAFSHIGVINAAVSLAHAGQAGSVLLHHADAARQSSTGGGGNVAPDA